MSDIPVGIPGELFGKLREALLDCGYDDYQRLKPFFDQHKLIPWKHYIPRASHPVTQVNQVISYLYGRRRTDTKENALVLLLRALSEENPGDDCHQHLKDLADELVLVVDGGGAERSSASLQKFLDDLRRQIAQGEVGLVLDQLQNYLMSANVPELRNEVISLSRRYQDLRHDERKGLIIRETAKVDRAQLVEALLLFLEEIPKRVSVADSPVAAPALKKELLVVPEEVGLEKILGINNLKQISWIETGLQASRSVCRILTPVGMGTGFLIAPDLLMTNHHVIPSKAVAAKSRIEFDYQQNFMGDLLHTYRYCLDIDRFESDGDLDYTIVGVRANPDNPDLRRWGFLNLNPHADPVPGEHVVIIQHPNGGLKQIALTANQVTGLRDHRLHYTTDTMPGSSGAPVFNDSWHVIAIHHAGGDLEVNAKGDKRFVNEGILMSAIKPSAVHFWPD